MGERKKSSSSRASMKMNKQGTLDHFVKKPVPVPRTEIFDGVRDERKINRNNEDDTTSSPATTPEPVDIRTWPGPENTPQEHTPQSPPSSPIIIASEDEIEVTNVAPKPLTDGGSRRDPILVESSPIKPRPVLVHPFFAPRARQRSVTPSNTSFPSASSSAPYPSRETQHLRGPQHVYQASHSHTTLMSTTKPQLPTPLTFLDHLPEPHRSHPAINRFIQSPVKGDPLDAQRLWSDKWRPTSADQVLGNEENSRYLRKWLGSLQLQLTPHQETQLQERSSKDRVPPAFDKSKKRRITAHLTKRSRKKQRVFDSDDEWIVQDTIFPEPEEDASTACRDEDDYEPPIRPESSHTPSILLDAVLNTIILVGPRGSGKTAAVYACAEELGWEIFELYPGLGKRNSFNMDNLVGQVGKNHIVSKAAIRDEDTSKSTLLQAKSQQLQDITSNSSINQSLILFEEVDVLFKEDSNFWPGVINLIRDCKRPVIFTCNDLSLLPIADLPVQNILRFEPCEADLAVSYLQGLCAVEGHTVSRRHLSQLYAGNSIEDRMGMDCIDLPTPDLRFAIHTLQLRCLGRSDHQPRSGDLHQPLNHAESLEVSSATMTDLSLSPKGSVNRNSTFHTDLLSYSDCHLARLVNDTPEAIALSEVAPSPDDEIGHAILFNPRDTLTRHDFYGQRDRDRLIVSRLVDNVRGTFSFSCCGSASTRVADGEALERLGKDVIGLHRWHREPFFVDYLPLIRQIIAADDEEEKKTMNMEVPGGRRTKNSQSQRYIRTISVTNEQRQALGRTAFGGSCQHD